MGSETSQLADENRNSSSEKHGEPESDQDRFLRTVYGSLWRGTALTKLMQAEKPREIPRLADRERRYILAKHTTSSGTSIPLFWPRSDSFSKCYTISTTDARNELHIDIFSKDEYQQNHHLNPSEAASRAMRKRISALQILDICIKVVHVMTAQNLESVDFFVEVQRLWIENTIQPRKDHECCTKISRVYGEMCDEQTPTTTAADTQSATQNGLMMFKCAGCRRKMERKWPIEVENGAYRNFCDCCGASPVVLQDDDGDSGNPLMFCEWCKVLVCSDCVAAVVERYSSDEWIFV